MKAKIVKQKKEMNNTSATNLEHIIPPNPEFGFSFYILKYKHIPNLLKLTVNTNTAKLFKVLSKEYLEAITWTKAFRRQEDSKIKRSAPAFMANIKEGLVLEIDTEKVHIYFSNAISTREVAKIKSIILSCKKEDVIKKRTFNIIKRDNYGNLELANFEIKKNELEFESNYNDDLLEIHSKIEKFVSSDEKNGIVLFHGIPGGGKNSYLRHLISSCEARFIYIPNNLFSELSSPSFMDFISGFPNSIIILEDCEDILKPREEHNMDTGISTLLNLGDGLLGDALKIKIICTFNTELKNIDQALLRKGRLVQRYEFKELSVEKANKFLEKKNVPNRVMNPTALAELYTILEDNGNTQGKETKKIGFKTN